MKTLSSVFIFLFFCSVALSQAPLVKQWDKRYGGAQMEFFNSFVQTNDGGYILAGTTQSTFIPIINGGDIEDSTRGSWDFWIIKVDSIGNKEWNKRYGGANGESLTSFQSTSDGGYILGGSSMSDSSGDKTQANRDTTFSTYDYWIVKIDSVGNKQWDKSFGGTSDDQLFSIQQTNDEGYILGGQSYSEISGDKTQTCWDTFSPINARGDYWVVKIDSSGNKEWDKRFGGIGTETFGSLIQTYDGGYILGGSSGSNASGDKTQELWDTTQIQHYGCDYWVVKIDSLGNKIWDKRYGGFGRDRINALLQTSNGGFILGGESSSDIGGDKTENCRGYSDYWIVKIDSIGNQEWDRRFGGVNTDELRHVFRTHYGGYLLSGDSYSTSVGGDKSEPNFSGPEKTWIIKTDAIGNKQWDKTLFTISLGDDESGYAIQTEDGSYVIANCTAGDIGGYKSQDAWGSHSYDYWLIKFSDTTGAYSNVSNAIEENIVSVYPNPSTGTWHLIVDDGLIGATVEMLDTNGSVVFKSVIQNSQSEITADVSRGVYLLKINSSKSSVIKKLMRL